GGCVHLAWDDESPDFVYTTHHGNLFNPTFLSGWDISRPGDMGAIDPVQLPVTQEPGVSYEGVDAARGHVYVALNDKGLGVDRRDPQSGALARVGLVGSGFGSAWGVLARGETLFVTDEAGALVVLDARHPAAPRIVGRAAIPGVPHGLVVAED